MDENYYRGLIDRVNINENAMWGGTDDPNYGYEDFNSMWGLLSDTEAKVSPKTYFEAIDLCINSFFGTIQDHSYVWRNVASYYNKGVEDKDSAFIKELESFLSDLQSSIPEMSVFYDLMHLAIEDGDFKIVNLLINHSPIEIEGYEQLEEDYRNYPEWAAYIEGSTDISYEPLPHAPIFRETIKRLYSKFGHRPDMEKLGNLYDQFRTEV